MSRRPKRQLPAPAFALVPREVPSPPVLLGEEGRKAWFYLWEQHWLNPRRHCRIATRYCQLQDLLAAAFAQVKRDGLMVKGSQGQLRIHPGMVEIRLLSTECRLIETELGLTPGSESRAGADRQLPPGPLDAMLARQREGA